jgi:acetyltransferase-like isoleucine patch superfamily enzyme
MRTSSVLRRFLIPRVVGRLLYFVRFRALISPRAEVQYSSQADWGRGCVVSSFTKIKIDGPFRMGRKVQIAAGCFISVSPAGLTIGDDVLVGPNCTIVTDSYAYDRLDVPLREQGLVSKGVTIGRNVWIGANSVVLDGARIGDNAIIASGSVVSGALADNAIGLGNPVRVVFSRR